jgi:phosphoribosyl 1,2-cyclic phosphodiesterase
MTVKVKFWGVRGSIACPGPDHVVYGGNTSCIEVSADNGVHIILDAGTGMRGLGRDYLARPDSRSALLLLTHTHWDHINGFPFFAPAYQPGWSFVVMAGHLSDRGGIQSVLASQMAYPMFPVPLGAMRADMVYRDFRAGETLTDLLPGVVVRTAPLNHPDGATAYRIETGGKVVCLVTDTEHVTGQPNTTILGLIAGADLVIYDSTYTDAEFPAKLGWGHSTWQEGIRLARAAGVKRLAIFHHDPDHDDTVMAAIEAEAKAQWSGALIARDTMEVVL